MTFERRLQIIARWSFVTAVAIALIIWISAVILGHVPHEPVPPWLREAMGLEAATVPRWIDVLLGPLWAAIIAFVLTSGPVREETLANGQWGPTRSGITLGMASALLTALFVGLVELGRPPNVVAQAWFSAIIGNGVTVVAMVIALGSATGNFRDRLSAGLATGTGYVMALGVVLTAARGTLDMLALTGVAVVSTVASVTAIAALRGDGGDLLARGARSFWRWLTASPLPQPPPQPEPGPEQPQPPPPQEP